MEHSKMVAVVAWAGFLCSILALTYAFLLSERVEVNDVQLWCAFRISSGTATPEQCKGVTTWNQLMAIPRAGGQ